MERERERERERESYVGYSRYSLASPMCQFTSYTETRERNQRERERKRERERSRQRERGRERWGERLTNLLCHPYL